MYFGRDCIGRHSLLLKLDSERNFLTLTSVSSKTHENIIEVPAIGVFAMDLSGSTINLTCHPWREPDLRFTDVIEEMEKSLQVDINIEEAIFHSTNDLGLVLEPETQDLEFYEAAARLNDINDKMEYLLSSNKINKKVERLLDLLRKSVEVRVKKKPDYCKNCVQMKIDCRHAKIGILFSGGLDSAILALITNEFVPIDEPIDLINVAFERNAKSNENSAKYEVPDRKTGKQTLSELMELCPERKWNFVQVKT